MAVATGREYGLFINGETVDGSSSRELIEPASGEPFATAQLAGEPEIDQAVEAARTALADVTRMPQRSYWMVRQWKFARTLPILPLGTVR